MMKKGRTDSDMTPFSMYRSSERQPRNLTEEEKNQVSHRGKALQLMKEELKKYENIDRK